MQLRHPALFERLLLALAVIWMLHGVDTVTFNSHDSPQYIEMASNLVTGTFFPDRSELSFGMATRTPGFPLLLLLGALMNPSNIVTGIYIVHLTLAIIAVLYFAEAYSVWIPRLIAGAWAIVGLSTVRHWSMSLMSEWSALCLLFILASALVQVQQRRTIPAGGFASFLCALLILIRPACSFALPITIGWVYWWLRGSLFSRYGLAMMIGAVSPILLWMSINLIRQEKFELSPMIKVSSFGVAMTIGSAQVLPDDSPQLAEFIRRANSARLGATQEDLEAFQTLDAQAFGKKFIANYYDFPSAFQRLSAMSWIDIFPLMARYALRAIYQNHQSFLRYVCAGFSAGLVASRFCYALLLLLTLLQIQFSLSASTLNLAWIAGLLHFTHMLLMSLTSFMQGRYFALTYALMLTTTGCAVAEFAMLYRAGKK